MTPTTFEDALDGILAELRSVLVERQAKYGSQNIERLGLAGVLDRIRHDKIERIGRVVDRMRLREACLQAGMPRDVVDQYLPLRADFADERFRDAVLDMAGYSVIMMMLVDGVWGLPLEAEG